MSQSSLVNYRRISPNCTKPRRNKITHIVIHHMAGNCSVETCGEIFAPVARQASSHYGIGSDGRIGQYCYEENRAWTTSNAEIDHKAITIEVADDKYGAPWHSSNAAMRSLIKLCVDICKRNGIKELKYTGDKSGNLHKHCWYANTDCPGSWLGSQFPTIASEVTKVLRGGISTAYGAGPKVPSLYTGSFPTRFPKRIVPRFKLGDGYDRCTGYVSEIKKIQMFLNWAIGANLTVDGHYGPKSVAACKKFQLKIGMTNPKGNFGKGTLKKAKTFKA